MSLSTCCLSCDKSEEFEVEDEDVVTADTVLVEPTSMILSAKSANCVTFMSSRLDARIVWTWCGNRCKNNCLKIVSSRWSLPSSCSMLRSSWEGLRSPNSSCVSSWWSLFCSEIEVLRINSAFRCEYGLSAGGFIKMSLTSCAISGWSADTM